MRIPTYPRSRLLRAAGFLFFSLCLASSAPALTLSVTGPITANAGDTGLLFDIVADEALVLGSTDINFNWDAVGLLVTDVNSPLSSFTPVIDNSARQVRTASAASPSDTIAAGTPLMTFTMTATSSGVYDLFITDADGELPNDLAGPVPPVPPDSISYSAEGHAFTVPEPGTGLLVMTGLIGLAITGRRHRA
jgi:hypothetical protein